MKININEKMRVVLTETGAAHYNSWNSRYPVAYRPPLKQAGDVLEAQLWELFQIFGETIYMGMGEVPFENCIIEFLLIDAPKASAAPVVPDGFQLVPIEPTSDMVVDGFEAASEFRDTDEYTELSGCERSAKSARICYAAMLAAAPQGEPK
jgi:hypothetical protein